LLSADEVAVSGGRFEGLRRLAARGCRTASLDTGDGEAANAFYAASGFTEAVHFHSWRRTW